MELRVLKFFLAVAREQSISGAAEYLYLSQPTLSRQLKELEDELGKQLFIRGNRKITLTEEGMLLRKRAEEILELVKKAENEISLSDEIISGDIYIGAGETDAIRLIARTAKKIQDKYPLVRFHIFSGDSRDVSESLNKGLIDFGILFEPANLSKYDYLSIPVCDTWGVLMKKDAPLSEKKGITPEDLWDKPLLISRQQRDGSSLMNWFGKKYDELNVSASYNLVYNASLMVDEDMGYALTLAKLINTTGDSDLCFIPLEPKLKAKISFAWKKYQIFTKAGEKFLEQFKEDIAQYSK